MTVDNTSGKPLFTAFQMYYPQQFSIHTITNGMRKDCLWITFFIRLIHIILQFWYFFIFGILHRLHNAGCLFQLRDRMACNDLQSLHQHTVLVVCDRHCLICRTGPTECTIIESLVHKEKTIAFPEQCFDPVTSSSTEKKQCILS